jgi:hypothetical protein
MSGALVPGRAPNRPGFHRGLGVSLGHPLLWACIQTVWLDAFESLALTRMPRPCY